LKKVDSRAVAIVGTRMMTSYGREVTQKLAGELANYLIQNGVKPITSAKDVLDELHLQLKVDLDAVEKVMPGSPIESKIIEILECEPLHLDELVRISGIPTPEVSARLTIMEMKGLVRNLGNGIYKKL
jgi:DNA processing protein